MGGNKSEKLGADGPEPCAQPVQSGSGVPQDLPVSAILVAHTQKFDDILHAVQSIKSTVEPKIDTLCIEMGHLREEHKKLKERVASAEGGLGMVGGQRHGFGLAAEAFALGEVWSTEGPQGRHPAHVGGPRAEQASMERDRACVEVERRVGSPASSARSVDQQDVVSPDLEVEQVILGEGPTVTPQTAEDLL
ncbi:hypothetical protein NDU88_007196 [Pleurodeles waltl]|uniref:Uncharacterized protein n=1 Tax=Pleurodeles waltl TaxID=8319 RepID=A0AAV7QL22_PLEWA|nr:hypothetical protein NDU88_007196 [Pleurodeles waltl]